MLTVLGTIFAQTENGMHEIEKALVDVGLQLAFVNEKNATIIKEVADIQSENEVSL